MLSLTDSMAINRELVLFLLLRSFRVVRPNSDFLGLAILMESQFGSRNSERELDLVIHCS